MGKLNTRHHIKWESFKIFLLRSEKQFIFVTSGDFQEPNAVVTQTMENERRNFGCNVTVAIILVEGILDLMIIEVVFLVDNIFLRRCS